MDNGQFCFIICYNNMVFLAECLTYIKQLTIPDGFTIDVITIAEAGSMASGYQAGMEASTAKYKIYLHQDVFILNKNFLHDTLQIFKQSPSLGMLGMVGTKKLPESAIMWESKNRIGALRSCSLNTTDDYFDIPIENTAYELATAVDGLLIMTQYDISWREDIFDGWDFYDVSQSFEFKRAGYDIAVPYQKVPWVLHDCGFLNLKNYYSARDKFIKEYAGEF
ncbi:MAG: hypothetical protein HFH70_05450 [Lachnospiraceae bacterium]|nr:hypothetical protein [Lachnospiraceae bacterium]